MKDQPPPSHSVLIVEDENDLRTVLKLIIEVRFGCRVLEALDGETAIELATREEPSLILMDLLLPKMSGFEALESIRAVPALEKTPIIVISDYCWDVRVKNAVAHHNPLLCVDKAYLMEELPPLLASVLGVTEPRSEEVTG